MSETTAPARRRRRFAPLMIVAGLASAVVLSLAMTNTLSAFIAVITNSNDTAATGTVVLQETNSTGTVTCNSTDSTTISVNSASCSTINKYGGSTTMVPSNVAGTTNTIATTVNMKNTGTSAAASFTVGFGACTPSKNGAVNGTATDFCSKLHVTVMSGTTTVVANSTAAALATTTTVIPAALIPAAGGASVPFTITVYVDSTADNTYQGLAASQPIVWTLSS